MRAADAEAALRATPPFAERVAEAAHPSSVGMRPFARGVLSAAVLPPKLAVGCAVTNTDKENITVVSMFPEAGNVALKPNGGDQRDTFTVSAAQFMDEHKVIEEERVVTKRIAGINPSEAHRDILVENAKSQIRLVLNHLYASELENVDVTLQFQPNRCVFSNAAYEIGKLVLVPLSTKVQLTSGKVPAASVDLGVVLEKPQVKAAMRACVDARVDEPKDPCASDYQPFVVPFLACSQSRLGFGEPEAGDAQGEDHAADGQGQTSKYQ